jgi:hypothetical protein
MPDKMGPKSKSGSLNGLNLTQSQYKKHPGEILNEFEFK